MTAKHSSKAEPLFYGHRTKEDEERSFAGYAINPEVAELYSISEIISNLSIDTQLFCDLPVHKLGGSIRRYSMISWQNHRNEEDLFAIKPSEVGEVVQK